ncbi:MAG: glucosaminidase domain-containing protein [Flavisolibacter sp.]
MQKHKLSFTILFALISNLVFAQSTETVRNYIGTYKDIAIAEEIRTGVPAAITLAQGIHETGAGTSDLVLASNNHFGIKCKGDWTGASVFHDDDAKGECFRKYEDPRDSYKDHSDFLKNRPNYTSLFKLDPTDYKGWAYGLKRCGYATNPRYAQILIKLIEDYNLEDYTMLALSGKYSGDGNNAAWASADASKSDAETETKTVVQPVVQKTVIYPSGVFRINQTDVVFVNKGTAYLKIAEEHNLSLTRLFEFNEIKPADIAEKDGLVFLQRKRKTGTNEFHIVSEGENLHDIAQNEGIRLEDLMQLNLLREGMQPQAGERLYLQTKASYMPRILGSEVQQSVSGNSPDAQQTPGDDVDRFILHTVQPKETVYAISKKYSVSIEDVMKWNELQSTDLKTGQQLRINKRSMNATN